MVYTIKNHCIEVPDMEYQDGLQFIYFNTEGTVGGSKDIKNMLDYMQKSRVSDEATKEIDEYVNSVKSDPTIMEGLMTLGEHFDIEREEGRLSAQRQCVIELLEDLGEVPENIIDSLEHITASKELSQLLKAAAKANSIEEFEVTLDEIFDVTQK